MQLLVATVFVFAFNLQRVFGLKDGIDDFFGVCRRANISLNWKMATFYQAEAVLLVNSVIPNQEYLQELYANVSKDETLKTNYPLKAQQTITKNEQIPLSVWEKLTKDWAKVYTKNFIYWRQYAGELPATIPKARLKILHSGDRASKFSAEIFRNHAIGNTDYLKRVDDLTSKPEWKAEKLNTNGGKEFEKTDKFKEVKQKMKGNLSIDQIRLVWDLCRYETATWGKDSSFCENFDKYSSETMEYLDDLFYWQTEHRQSVISLLTYVKDILTTKKTEWHNVHVIFLDGELYAAVVKRLGEIFKQDFMKGKVPSANSFAPVSQLGFRTSKMAPILGTVALMRTQFSNNVKPHDYRCYINGQINYGSDMIVDGKKIEELSN